MKRYIICISIMIFLISWTNSICAGEKDEDFTGATQAHDSLSFSAKLKGKVVTKGDILFNEGKARRSQGDYEGALYKWQAAIKAFETDDKGLSYMTLGLVQLMKAMSMDEKEKIPAVYNHMGDVYLDINDYNNALITFRKGLDLAENYKQDKEAVRSMIGLASVYKELGDDQEALLYFNKAIERAIQGQDQYLQATALGGIANLYLTKKSYHEAYTRYQNALSLVESIKDRTLIISTYYGIGLSLIGQGQHDKALPFLQRSLALAREQKDMGAVVAVLNTIGFSHIRLKNYDKAKQAFAEGISLISVFDLILPAQRSYANYGMGIVYAQTGDIPKAIKSLRAAVKDIEEIRGRISTGEYQIGFFENKTAVYEELINLLMLQHKEAIQEKTENPMGDDPRFQGQTSEEIAFFFMESTKGRSFLDMLARNNMDMLSGHIPKELADKERRLLQTISILQTSGDVGSKTRRDALKKSQQELDKLIAKLKIDFPDYAAIRYPEPVTVHHIPLREGEVLLAYKVNPKATYLWIVKKGERARVYRINVSRDELTQQISSFLKPLQDLKHLKDFDPLKGESLCRLLLGNVLPELRQEQHIIIIPDGPLYLLPFEALVIDAFTTKKQTELPHNNIKDLESITYVGMSYQISYYPSASVMAIIRKAKGIKQPKAPLLIVADPIYDENDERYKKTKHPAQGEQGKVMSASASISNVHLREIVINKGFSLPRLIETREEALEIGGLFGLKPDSPHIKLDLDARKNELLKMDLKAYRFLHFATHGLLSGDIPYIQEPALVLTLVGNQKEEDGFLKMSDVLGMRINPELVVLSACKTALGKEVVGEGIVGLSRAFMLSGAQSVVVSLWSVESKSTAELMKTFYIHLKNGMSKGEALRLAKISLLKGNKGIIQERGIQIISKEGRDEIYNGHPFFWAPFILIGEWH